MQFSRLKASLSAQANSYAKHFRLRSAHQWNLTRGGPLRNVLPHERHGHQFGKLVGSAAEDRATHGGNEELHDHRLIVMFFDLTSMQPDDLERSQEAARNYINKQMQPADLVAVLSLNSALTVDQDFTANKQLLFRAVGGTAACQGRITGTSRTPTQSRFGRKFTEHNREILLNGP